MAKLLGAGITANRTMTWPDADARPLTDHDAVTVPQGGTGLTSYAVGDIPYASSTSALSKLAGGVQQVRQNAHAAMRALSVGLPSQPPALNVAPTITLASAPPGSTPTLVEGFKGALALSPSYVFSGGTYIQVAPTFPYYTITTRQFLPRNTLGFGQAVAEFMCDAPLITVYHSRSNSTVTRVLVDGVEVLRCANALRAATAQAGAASTITLDAAASAVNGFYFNNWIHVTGGTGIGQYRMITAYVGATKIATVGAAWAVQPDATSTFEITRIKAAYSNSTQTGFTDYYFTLDWGGERRMRRYRIEVDGYGYYGVYVPSAIDSILPVPKPTALHCFWVGDSLSAGTGTDGGVQSSLARVCCDLLGWEQHDLSMGGTGYLSFGGIGAAGSFTAVQRITPPVNAWVLQFSGRTSGNFSVTQNGHTATFAFGASLATTQAALDAAFGAGAFLLVGGGAATASWYWLMGLGSNAAFAGAMTADFSAVVGGTPTLSRYLGDLAPNLPRDGAGMILPFAIVLACGHNDTTSTDATYTPALLQSTVTALLTALATLYPQATIFVVGNMYLPGGSVGADATAANAAISAACTAALPTINGAVPFIDTLTVPWMSGTGKVGGLTANGNSDVMCDTDGVHPTSEGHLLYGTRIARRIQELVGLA